MFIISYEENETRWDASSHTNHGDAEKQLELFANSGLQNTQIEEKNIFVPKPL